MNSFTDSLNSLELLCWINSLMNVFVPAQKKIQRRWQPKIKINDAICLSLYIHSKNNRNLFCRFSVSFKLHQLWFVCSLESLTENFIWLSFYPLRTFESNDSFWSSTYRLSKLYTGLHILSIFIYYGQNTTQVVFFFPFRHSNVRKYLKCISN